MGHVSHIQFLPQDLHKGWQQVQGRHVLSHSWKHQPKYSCCERGLVLVTMQHRLYADTRLETSRHCGTGLERVHIPARIRMLEIQSDIAAQERAARILKHDPQQCHVLAVYSSMFQPTGTECMLPRRFHFKSSLLSSLEAILLVESELVIEHQFGFFLPVYRVCPVKPACFSPLKALLSHLPQWQSFH